MREKPSAAQASEAGRLVAEDGGAASAVAEAAKGFFGGRELAVWTICGGDRDFRRRTRGGGSRWD